MEAFLKRGYSAVASSRNITRANPFPSSVNLALVDGDIGDPKTAAKIVDTAVSRFGRIDVLINNAGIFIPNGHVQTALPDARRASRLPRQPHREAHPVKR